MWQLCVESLSPLCRAVSSFLELKMKSNSVRSSHRKMRGLSTLAAIRVEEEVDTAESKSRKLTSHSMEMDRACSILTMASMQLHTLKSSSQELQLIRSFTLLSPPVAWKLTNQSQLNAEPTMHDHQVRTFQKLAITIMTHSFHIQNISAKLMWFLDEKELGSGNVQEEEINSQGSSISSFTTISRIQYRLKPEDDGGKLICRAEHIAYGDDKYVSTSYNLDVYYRPLPKDKIIFGGLETGKTAIVGPIAIMANPRPNQIKWSIDGTTSVIAPSNTPKYVATAPVATNGGWNVTLQIIDLTLEDFSRSYKLQVSNEYGVTDYTVKIQASPDINGELTMQTTWRRVSIDYSLGYSMSLFSQVPVLAQFPSSSSSSFRFWFWSPLFWLQ